MSREIEDVLRQSALFRACNRTTGSVSRASAACARSTKEPSCSPRRSILTVFTVLTGRVKVFKTTARGRTSSWNSSAPAIRWVPWRWTSPGPIRRALWRSSPRRVCVIPRQAFFSLLETYPTMVRGLLVGLTHRLVELTNRLAEMSGGRVEAGSPASFSPRRREWASPRRTACSSRWRSRDRRSPT